MESILLTHNKDTDITILRQLNGIDLYNTCMINKYLYGLCLDDKGLRTKLNKVISTFEEAANDLQNSTLYEYEIEIIEKLGLNSDNIGELEFATIEELLVKFLLRNVENRRNMYIRSASKKKVKKAKKYVSSSSCEEVNYY